MWRTADRLRCPRQVPLHRGSLCRPRFCPCVVTCTNPDMRKLFLFRICRILLEMVVRTANEGVSWADSPDILQLLLHHAFMVL